MRSCLPACVLLALTVCLAADFPQWRGTARDGIVSVPEPANWPEKLTQKWKVNVGVGHSSPIYASGKIFQFARTGDNEVLYAIGPASGNTRRVSKFVNISGRWWV